MSKASDFSQRFNDLLDTAPQPLLIPDESRPEVTRTVVRLDVIGGKPMLVLEHARLDEEQVGLLRRWLEDLWGE